MSTNTTAIATKVFWYSKKSMIFLNMHMWKTLLLSYFAEFDLGPEIFKKNYLGYWVNAFLVTFATILLSLVSYK